MLKKNTLHFLISVGVGFINLFKELSLKSLKQLLCCS